MSENGAGRKHGWRAGGRGGERPMVPKAEFASYYDRPILKPPEWKVPDIPGYFYLGGLAGASAVMAALAEATGRPALQHAGRLGAAGGSVLSVVALVDDLGRPERFLHMLRVLKPTSPLSVGSWILTPFSSVASAAAASQVFGILPRLGSAASAAAAALGPAMTVYTAVLVSDTAVPAWHGGYREMPFIFAGSAMASAGALGMISAPVDQAGPARRMAVLGSGMELAASAAMERRLGHLVGEPYHKGRSGALVRAAKALNAAGALAALFARRSRVLAALSGVALTAASICTRFGVFEAGVASAKDPKYTVIPQRERLESGRTAGSGSMDGQPR